MNEEEKKILKIQEAEKRREIFKALTAAWGPVKIGEPYQGGVESQVESQN